MKKKDYRKRKSVVLKKKLHKSSLNNRIVNAIPYLVFTTLFFGGIIYYIQYCFIYTYNNISPAVEGNHFRSIILPEFLPKNNEYTQNLNREHSQIIEHGSRDKKEVALTFDADMTVTMQYFLQAAKVKTFAGSTTVDFLNQHNIKATMFLTGLWIETYPEETKALAKNPLFELANHSYSHPSFAGSCFGLPRVPYVQYPTELEKTQKLLQQVTSKKAKYFRFPGGCYDQVSLELVKKEGMQTVHWDSVAHDGFNTNTDQIINNVLTQTQNGSIIVMHLGGETNTPKTVDALRVIYSQLTKKGYTFVTVSELLAPDHTKQATDLSSYLLIPELT